MPQSAIPSPIRVLPSSDIHSQSALVPASPFLLALPLPLGSAGLPPASSPSLVWYTGLGPSGSKNQTQGLPSRNLEPPRDLLVKLRQRTWGDGDGLGSGNMVVQS